MANLKNVIYLSNEDYETLVSTGTVTIDGETLTYDENNVYITPDKLASTTEDGLMSAADKSKLDNIESNAQVNIQADWNQTDTTADDYIKNKPQVDTDFSLTSTNALQNKVISEKLGYIDYALTHIKYKLFGVTTLSEIDYKVDYATIYPIPETLSDDDGTHRVVFSDTQLKEVEGNSVAFNQFAKPFNISGVWACSSALGTLSNETERSILYTRNNVEQASNVAILIQNMGAGYATTKGHKYFIKAFVTPSDNFKLNSYVGSYAIGKIMTANVKNNYEVIITANNDGYLQFISENGGHLPLGGTVLFEDTQLFDLTTSGIDFVETVEQAKAELLKRGINVDEYNEYNAGEIKSTVIKGVRIRNSKLATVPLNKISVVDLGTLSYEYVSSATNPYFYAFINGMAKNGAQLMCNKYSFGGNNQYDGTIGDDTIDKVVYSKGNSNVIYLRDTAYTDATAFKSAMSGILLYYECVEPQETIPQEIVNEFVTKTIQIPQTELPSAGSVHDTIKIVEGNIVAGQQRYNMVSVSRINNVDLGTLNWAYVSDVSCFRATTDISDIKQVTANNIVFNGICSKYKTTDYKTTTINNIKSISLQANEKRVWIHDGDLGTDATAFKTAMSGVILNYEKAEPTETTLATDLTFEEVSAIIEQGGSIETVFEIVPPNLKTAFVVNKVIVS